MEILFVQVSASLSLDAGSLGSEGEARSLWPPSLTMYDQLADWLSRQTPPNPTNFSTAIMGIGATALCLRWGTYLAVLLDESKPLDPGAGSAERSMISDHEMKRINLEFSANLARLIGMLHEDERGCYRLLHLSYRYLPMPQLRVRPCAELLDLLLGLTSPEFWNTAGADLRSRMDRARAIVVQHPYRILANSMTVAAYRNGPVEELHAGRASGYAMNRRRATDQQSRELMRFTSERLAAVLSGFRPWKRHSGHPWSWPENLAGIYLSPYLSPGNWSLCVLSCPVPWELMGVSVSGTLP